MKDSSTLPGITYSTKAQFVQQTWKLKASWFPISSQNITRYLHLLENVIQISEITKDYWQLRNFNH